MKCRNQEQSILPPEAKNIFVWHQGALGDVLLAGPALQAIAEHYPGARLTLVGGTEQLGLLTATLPVAAIRSGHLGLWLELFQDNQGIGSELKNLLSQFDLALVLTPQQRLEFLDCLKLAGIPKIFVAAEFSGA